MHTLPARTLAFAMALAALAGFVDAVGFLHMGGYFVSFMSGNSTRLTVALQQGDWPAMRTPGLLIACFVAGAAIGTAVKQCLQQAVLALVAALLLAAALCDTTGAAMPAVCLLALAMGTANAALHSSGGQVVGVTYMTGTLVKMGQRLAAVFLQRDPFSWVPHLLLWLGLMSGGIGGAWLFLRYGLHALWLAAAWAGALALLQYIKRWI